MKKVSENPSIRLQKFIADCGITSRRKAELLITEGRVKVNGTVATELGTKVIPGTDEVLVDGIITELSNVQKHYILLNKPKGYVTTLHDPEGRPTVMDLVKMISDRIYPVGRLDYYSEGLLLMTNDGEVANWVMHPSSDVHKVYEVKVFGKVNALILKQLRKGIEEYDGVLKPKSVRIIKELDQKTWLEFRLAEGKNREIRRICEACGLTIDKLRRVSIEGLSVEGLATGKYIFLTKKVLLSKLGLNDKGQRIRSHIEPVSIKKTIKVSGKKDSGKLKEDGVALATDEKFIRYRRENYQKTVKIQKEAMALGTAKAFQKSKEEAEAKFEVRRLERIKRRKNTAKRKKRI